MSNLSNSQINVLPHEHTSSEITDLSTLLNGKQDTLEAGSNIQIAEDGKTISATDTKYFQGTNVQISAGNVISATDTKYTAGENIQIDANNEISATDTTYEKASTSALGLIKLATNTIQSVGVNAASSTANRTYPVQLNDQDQAVVNVPWSDTTVSSATSSVAGTVKLASDTVQSVAMQPIGSTTNRTYGVQVNNAGQMVVNVPWENTQVSVVDNLTSSATGSALSANQGRILKGLVDEAKAKAKFLSLWDSSTGQPLSFPLSTPYTYTTGDYFMVETIPASGSKYMPNGVSYTGTASTTVDSTNDVQVGDFYIYDGASWLYAGNHGKEVSFANISGQPTDNANLSTALSGKQDTLTPGTGITINNGTISNSLPFSPSNAGTTGQVLTKTASGYNWGSISGGHDYSWVTKSGNSIEIGLRTIVNPTSNFTLTVPANLQDGMEYVLRCINESSYTITLGSGFTNPWNVDLTLSSGASDQFVFVAINGELELQAEVQVA